MRSKRRRTCVIRVCVYTGPRPGRRRPGGGGGGGQFWLRHMAVVLEGRTYSLTATGENLGDWVAGFTIWITHFLLQGTLPRGGGGGGALGYLGVRIRSLSIFKNTPKALISGQKSTLILIKRWFFPLNKHPFFYQKNWHWMNGNTYFNLRFYNPLLV